MHDFGTHCITSMDAAWCYHCADKLCLKLLCTRVFRQLFLYITQPTIAVLINVEILQMNSQLLLWSWKVAECSLIDNLIAKKLILATFRLDAPVLLSYINVGKMFSVYKNQPPPNPLTVQILSGITKFMKLLGI